MAVGGHQNLGNGAVLLPLSSGAVEAGVRAPLLESKSGNNTR